MLSWQYTEILKPYQFLKVRMNQYQQIAAQQLREKLNLLVQKGYIKAINNDYIATIKVSPDSFTSNGLELK